jgi:hypothetical protein
MRSGEKNSPHSGDRVICQASPTEMGLWVMTHADNITVNLRIQANVSMKELINISTQRRSFLKGMISAVALSTIGIASAEPAAKKKAAKKKAAVKKKTTKKKNK